MSDASPSRRGFWIAAQCVAAVALVAMVLVIDFLGASLTRAEYAARFGSVPAQLSECAYIVPRSQPGVPGTRGPPDREAMCFFGSRRTHQEAYVAAWGVAGTVVAVLVWTVMTGRGLPVIARRRQRAT